MMGVENDRWGILYCPKREISHTQRRWEKIQRFLEENKVNFDFVQSENSNSVERLMCMLINNGYKTIIIVGGDSALNDAVNCLMSVDKEVRDSISLGVIPNGVLNDFARYWEFSESNVHQTVSRLVAHRIRKIDLGCLHYINKDGKPCKRYFLNCVNIGLIAAIMNLRRQTRSLLGSRTLSFLVSMLLLIFQRLEYKMDININNDKIKRRVMTVCIGSARGYGQTPNAVPYNGLLDVSVVYHPEVMQLIEGFWLLLWGRFLNHRSVHSYRTSKVEIKEANHAHIGLDGRLMRDLRCPISIDINQEVINFLIPE